MFYFVYSWGIVLFLGSDVKNVTAVTQSLNQEVHLLQCWAVRLVWFCNKVIQKYVVLPLQVDKDVINVTKYDKKQSAEIHAHPMLKCEGGKGKQSPFEVIAVEKVVKYFLLYAVICFF